MGIRIKRILALVIDWNICFFPLVFLAPLVYSLIGQQSTIAILSSFLIMISPFALVVLRDVIIKGCSLGKRIMCLRVYDKETMRQASRKQCFLRNIFLFIYPIDGIILLATGYSVGDRAAGTVVGYRDVTKNKLPKDIRDSKNTAPVPKEKKRKTAVKVVAIVICGMIAFVGLIQLALVAAKDSEEYKIAYQYLLTSDAYRTLHVDESKIRMNQYLLSFCSSDDGERTSQTVEIGFLVDFRRFTVVCHKENGLWQVCEECTLFE